MESMVKRLGYEKARDILISLAKDNSNTMNKWRVAIKGVEFYTKDNNGIYKSGLKNIYDPDKNLLYMIDGDTCDLITSIATVKCNVSELSSKYISMVIRLLLIGKTANNYTDVETYRELRKYVLDTYRCYINTDNLAMLIVMNLDKLRKIKPDIRSKYIPNAQIELLKLILAEYGIDDKTIEHVDSIGMMFGKDVSVCTRESVYSIVDTLIYGAIKVFYYINLKKDEE